MSVPVWISGSLKDFVKGQSPILAEGSDLRSLISSMDEMFPGFLGKVIPEKSRPAAFRIYVSGKDMNLLAGLDTPVKASDEVIIFAPMSGG
jgi:molybdopterin converting factor small subunit